MINHSHLIKKVYLSNKKYMEKIPSIVLIHYLVLDKYTKNVDNIIKHYLSSKSASLLYKEHMEKMRFNVLNQ